MVYRVLTNYLVNSERDLYTVMSIEGISVEIHITKSVVSDRCFITIKEDGVEIVTGKLCTAFEYIYKSSRVEETKRLKGDFYFSYTTEDTFNKNFDYKYLGDKLFLFYDNKEE
jgi:hypothetical protein